MIGRELRRRMGMLGSMFATLRLVDVMRFIDHKKDSARHNLSMAVDGNLCLCSADLGIANTIGG